MTEYELSRDALADIADALRTGTYKNVEINDQGTVACIEVVGVGTIDLPAGAIVRRQMTPEPPNGTVYVNGTLVWVRDDDLDDPALPWWGTGSDEGAPWEVVAPIVAQPGWRRHIPDPADTAPALPWDVEDKDEDSLEIVTSDLVGVAALVSVNASSVYLAPAAAREAAGVLLRAVREFEERQR